MKRLLTVLFALVLGTVAFAQVGGVVYNPFNPQTQGQSKRGDSSRSQVYSTTAYSINSYGKISSMQIRVAVTQSAASYGGSVSERMNVAAIYSRSGLAGGYWQPLPTRPDVYQCSEYSNNRLEQQFMYMAMAGDGWVYFNL